MLLQPFGGHYPNTEVQFTQMRDALRRMGHILERSPGNVAGLLRRGGQPNSGSFFGEEQHHQPSQESSFPAWGGNQTTGWDTPGWGSGDHSYPSPVYPAHSPTYGPTDQLLPASSAFPTEDAYDSGTDTDTVSSTGENQYTMEGVPPGLSPTGIAEHLLWAYEQAKSRFRHYMGKPVRRLRRFMRHPAKGKSKGKGFGYKKGKGKGVGAYLASLSDLEVETTFFGKGPKGRGKSKGKRSSGKGFGRGQNPLGPDGERMKCFLCGSEEHLKNECPKGKGDSPHRVLYTEPSAPILSTAMTPPDEGPLGGMVFMVLEGQEQPPPSDATRAAAPINTNLQEAPLEGVLGWQHGDRNPDQIQENS